MWWALSRSISFYSRRTHALRDFGFDLGACDLALDEEIFIPVELPYNTEHIMDPRSEGADRLAFDWSACEPERVQLTRTTDPSHSPLQPRFAASLMKAADSSERSGASLIWILPASVNEIVTVVSPSSGDGIFGKPVARRRANRTIRQHLFQPNAHYFVSSRPHARSLVVTRNIFV